MATNKNGTKNDAKRKNQIQNKQSKYKQFNKLILLKEMIMVNKQKFTRNNIYKHYQENKAGQIGQIRMKKHVRALSKDKNMTV